jgi:hypothetical protein
MRHIRPLAVTGLVAMFGLAGTAHAAITGSSITSPAADAGYLSSSTPTPVAVSGTTTASGSSAVQLRCYQDLPDGSLETSNQLGTLTTPGGAFSSSANVTALLSTLKGGCRLRAVPDVAPGDLSPFTGPMLFPQHDDRTTIAGGPNAGAQMDVSATFNQPSSLMQATGVGCGLCDLQYAADEQQALPSWFTASGLYGFTPDPTRTAAMVDGHETFFAGDVYAAGFRGYAHYPAVTDANVTPTSASTTGTMSESETPVHCPTDPAPTTVSGGPAITPGSCPSFAPAGVRFDRSYRALDSSGRSWRITDVVQSIDGQAHQLDLLYSNEPGNLDDPKVQVPWAADPSFAWTFGSFGAPSRLPATIFTQYDASFPAGPQNPSGALTVGPGFVGASLDDTTFAVSITTHYVRTVPAGGAVTIEQVATAAPGEAEARTRAAQAETALAPPAISTVPEPSVVPTPPPGGGTVAPPPPPRDTTKPVLSRLSHTKTSFRATLSEAATLTVAIARRDAGRRSGKSCKKPTRKLRRAKACTRLTTIGSLTAAGRSGANTIAFKGKVGKKSLRPGAYLASFVARDAAGNLSAAKTVTFTVAAPKPKKT